MTSSPLAFLMDNNMKVSIEYSNQYYHEFLQSSFNEVQYPHIVCMFNAGLWGYQSWIPTISSFAQLARYETVFLVTSYTFLESEDDYDTIDSIINKTHPDSALSDESSCEITCKWLWDCEVNPFRSLIRLERKTAIEEREYYDNHSWQCFEVIKTNK
jgi:hypothetical protein